MTSPFFAGSCDAIAGRSMPGRVFSTNLAIAISAPVFPAETQACAAPALTRLIATRIDESFLRRSASAGGSSMSTTSLAGCTTTRSRSAAGARCSAFSMASGRPTRITRVSDVDSRNCSDAGTVTAGP